MDAQRFPELLAAIYETVDELEGMFPGRHFTPDGHMVGSIGEALAAYHYGVELLPPSAETHDGVIDGRYVQVKATQRDRIGIRAKPDHLLVLRIARDGTFEEAYNGPGALVWGLVADKPLPRNGQHQISLSKLRSLMQSVPDRDRITRVL